MVREVEPFALVRVQDHDAIRRHHLVLVEIGRIAGGRFLESIRRSRLRLTLIERKQRSAAALSGEDDPFEAALLSEVAHRRRDIEQ